MREGDARRGAIGADLGPDDARALLRAWLDAVDLRLDERELLALPAGTRTSATPTSAAARGARTSASSRGAVDGVAVAAATTGGDLGAARGRPLRRLRRRDPLRARGRLPRPREGASSCTHEGEPLRVALVADAVGAMHGVTHTLDEIRERGVPGFEVEVVGTDANVDRAAERRGRGRHPVLRRA